MIRANEALYRQAEEFFKQHLMPTFRWDRVKVISAPENPEHDGRRVLARMGPDDKHILADSRFREMVRLQFLPWEIIMLSAVEEPPLGSITLRTGGGTVECVKGPIDSTTWRAIAAHIKTGTRRAHIVKERDTSHVDR